MEDSNLYQIQLRGPVASSDLLAFSPPGLLVEPLEEGKTLLTLYTDQSGLVGLIRHLHGHGLVLLKIDCIKQNERN